MSKYKYDWNEEKYNKRIEEGRGQGTENSYKPWIIVHDFPFSKTLFLYPMYIKRFQFRSIMQ